MMCCNKNKNKKKNNNTKLEYLNFYPSQFESNE